jgi:hypothetical protein
MRLTSGWLFAGLITAAPPLGGAPVVPPEPQCADSIAKGMAFLAGNWKGSSYSVAGRDTTEDATMLVESARLYRGCALEEKWSAVQGGKTLFRARVLRAFDAASSRWLVYYVDDQLNSQFYEGRHESGRWRFLRTRMDGATPIQVRLTWSPAGQGYEQLIERSRDGGKTWVLAGFVRFKPSHLRGSEHDRVSDRYE